MIVVFDSNIWKANLYLKSSASAAVKFFLQRHAARVGLPEVIRLEVERHLRIDIQDMRDRISREHKRLLGLFDKLPEIVLPDDQQIDTLVASIFSQSNFDLVDIPFSERSARGSFLRTVEKIPPSHKSQQFKDGVLWEDCKQLAETEDVVLVTDDRAFYEDDNVKKGLANTLAAEVKECGCSLRVFVGLPELLREIRKPILIAESVLKGAVLTFLAPHINLLLGPWGFSLGQNWRFEKTPYATEDTDSLYIDLIAEVDCEDFSNEGRTNCLLRIAGDGSYDVACGIFDKLSPRELSVSYLSAEKTPGKMSSIFASGNIVLGHRQETNLVRARLDEQA